MHLPLPSELSSRVQLEDVLMKNKRVQWISLYANIKSIASLSLCRRPITCHFSHENALIHHH